MVYKNKFIAAVRVNGTTLRENGHVVELPFQSEYSIFLKNLESKKCKISIEIDGVNVTEGGILLNPFSEMSLERFLNSDRKFKFIKKTQQISEYRGDWAEDGIILIKYAFEKEYVYDKFTYKQPKLYETFPYNETPYWVDDSSSIIHRNGWGVTCSSTINEATIKASNFESGITVEGSKSNQAFVPTSDIVTDDADSIVFHLMGADKPILTSTKKTCPSCGKSFSSKFEFCPHDGTALK